MLKIIFESVQKKLTSYILYAFELQLSIIFEYTLYLNYIIYLTSIRIGRIKIIIIKRVAKLSCYVGSTASS